VKVSFYFVGNLSKMQYGRERKMIGEKQEEVGLSFTCVNIADLIEMHLLLFYAYVNLVRFHYY